MVSRADDGTRTTYLRGDAERCASNLASVAIGERSSRCSCGVDDAELAAHELRHARTKAVNEFEQQLELDGIRPTRVAVWRLRMPKTMPFRNKPRLLGRLGTPPYKSLPAVTRHLETHLVTIEQPLHHAQEHHGAA